MRDSAPRSWARRSCAQYHREGARPSCARSDTARPPTSASGPPATRPPIRSRRSSTALSPPARRAESSAGGRTVSYGRSSRSGGRTRPPTASSTASTTARTRRTQPRSAGSSATRSFRCCAGCIQARSRTSSPWRTSARRCRASSSARWSISSHRPPGRRPPISAAASVRYASTSEVRLEGRVTFGPWRIESARPGLTVRTRRPGDRLAGRTKKIQDVFVDAKVPSAARDAWPIVVSRQRGRGRSRTRGGAWLGRHGPRMERLRDVTQTELDKAVGEVLIEEDAIQSRIGELGVEISADYAGRDLLLVGVLKGAGLLHGRSHARADRAVRDRLHGDLELRGRDRLLGCRADPQRPRHQRHGEGRPRRRGHHRLRPDALVPDAKPRARKPASLEVWRS